MRHHLTAIIGSLFILSACVVGDTTVDGDDGPPTILVHPLTCNDGVRNGGELGVDCGGMCSASCDDVFERDANTLAIFELNGDLTDSSGNGRDARLIGGTFVATAWGAGLALDGRANQGFEWSLYADHLVYPYTVEMVLTPSTLKGYRKLFGPSDSRDDGWYLNNNITVFPDRAIPVEIAANVRHYLVFVSRSASQVDVYLNGQYLTTVSGGFSGPTDAVFFRDDTNTQRTESFRGVVDAVRLSKSARTNDEIVALAKRLAEQP